MRRPGRGGRAGEGTGTELGDAGQGGPDDAATSGRGRPRRSPLL